jgi:hypothetical protein
MLLNNKIPVLLKVSSTACLLATITTRHVKYDGTINHKPADSLLPFTTESRWMEGVAHLQFRMPSWRAKNSFAFDFAHSLPTYTVHTHTHIYIYMS